MNTPLIDIGANLTHESFAKDLEQVIDAAASKSINRLIITGASMAGSEAALTMAQQYPNRLYATAGIHPHHAEETNSDVIKALTKLATATEVRAIGETGLDFFRDLSPRETQIASFEAHIAIAIETGLPMFLHERDAYPTFYDVLKAYRSELSDVVVHCFTGSEEALHAYLDLDCHIGITGWICDERRGAHLIPLMSKIPNNRLMIETDSPYLTPRTIRPKTHRNVPANLSHICEFIANVLNMDYSQLALQTTRNAEKFFRLSEAYHVKLYTTLGCHLCEDALMLLNQYQSQTGTLTIELVEISDDDAMVEEYGIRIPVIALTKSEAETQELSWPFDMAALINFIEN